MNLIQLYIPLIGWVGLGVVLGRVLPSIVAKRLGLSLFWVGVPLSIMIFLRQADLTGAVWMAPIVCWGAVLSGAAIAGLWLRAKGQWPSPTQGSFLNASMFGNTGYLGYPITLALVGPKYFAWAVFYDTLGSTLATYGLGVAMASNLGKNPAISDHSNAIQRTLSALLKNPALWSFAAGLGLRQVTLSDSTESFLRIIAWTIIALSLLLLGMRLSQLSSRSHVQKVSVSLMIKMVIVPLIVALGVSSIGITGSPRLVLVLQAAMPPAFSTLILAEAYNLDRDLTVTALAIGTTGLFLTLPIWLRLFG
ncbi:MAG: AEC family transporter [Cyanobacteria bacterium P01_E01_bin.6]